MIKRVSELKKGDKGTILKITASGPIKNRLFAMGIVPGSQILVLDYTLLKKTWEVESSNTRIALRKEEAEEIFVEMEA